MDKRTVYNAICEIDEGQLNEYDDNCKSIKKRRKAMKQIITVSACFALVAAVGIALAGGGVFSAKPQISKPGTTVAESKNETVSQKESEENTGLSETANTEKTNDKSTLNNEVTSEEITERENSDEPTTRTKGGDTPERIMNMRIGADGAYYKVFKPGVDKFEPIDDMTLENRFCAFDYNGLSYYPAPDGDITADDYEPKKLTSVKAVHWELRSANPNDETSGIVYYAGIDVYKLKGIEPSEAVACVISFNGETKEYKYNATKNIGPSWQP